MKLQVLSYHTLKPLTFQMDYFNRAEMRLKWDALETLRGIFCILDPLIFFDRLLAGFVPDFSIRRDRTS